MGSLDINIRLAMDNDFDIIYQIWLDGIDNSFDRTKVERNVLLNKFKDNFDKRSDVFNYWIAECDGVVLGWQSLIKASSNPFREEFTAESSTYIAKECRLKGVGETLISYVMKEAENSHLEYIIGYVAVENIAARKITQRTGWTEVGEIPCSLKNKNNKRKLFLIRPV